jgi:hypothetical protein
MARQRSRSISLTDLKRLRRRATLDTNGRAVPRAG